MPRVDPSLAAAGSGRIPKTVEAYLTAKVEAWTEVEGGLLPQEEEALRVLHDEVQCRHAPPVVTGTQLYTQLERCSILETGCETIDADMLRGGMRGGQLIEICGESAAGKTQLCVSAAASAACSNLRVVYIDTSNAFSGRRLAQLVLAQQQAAGQDTAVAAAQTLPTALKFVEVRRCYDVHSLLAVLDELLVQAQQGQQLAQQGKLQQWQQGEQHGGQQQGEHQPGRDPAAQQRQQDVQQHAGQAQQRGTTAAASGVVRRRLEELSVGLLVVDCLSALIAPILGGRQHSQGHTLLAMVATTLKAFAAHSRAVVLVTNHLVGGNDERRHEKRPAMGESWRNQPHTRIQLSKPLPSSTLKQYTATLRASSLLPVGFSVPYYLGESGLSPNPLPSEEADRAAVGLQSMQH